MAATKGGSWDRLLDAAEHVFAAKGYDAATTREIASRSGDTLGTLSYHFKSKDTLLEEVLKRRLDGLNDERRSLYESFAARRNGQAPDLEEVITSISLPLLRLALTGGAAWSNYLTVLCRTMFAAGGDQAAMFAKLLDPVGIEFLGWLKAACPPSTHVSAAYAYQFIIGTTLDAVVQGSGDRLSRISGGAASARDFDAVSERLVPFLVAGVRAIVAI